MLKKTLKLSCIFFISIFLMSCSKPPILEQQNVIKDDQINSRIAYPICDNAKLDDLINLYLSSSIAKYEKYANPLYSSITYEIAYPFDDVTSIIFTHYLNEEISYYALTFNTKTNTLLHLGDVLIGASISEETSSFYINEDELIIITENNERLAYPTSELITITPLLKKTFLSILENSEIIKSPIDPNKPMIALTFDDGPHHRYTDQILDTLSENNAYATFFVVGSQVEKNPEIITKMLQNGNQIGNHTYSHRSLLKISLDQAFDEINKTKALLADFNYEPTLIRPPYGAYNEALTKAFEEPFVLWSIDTRDWSHQDTDKIVDIVLKEVSNGDVVLFHDMYESTMKAIKILVPQLIKDGYQLVTIDEMIKNTHNKCIKE